MNPSIISFLRSFLKIGGGILVAQGWADDNTAEVIAAGLTALIGVVWGVADRKSPPAAQRASTTPLVLAAAIAISGGLVGCGSLDKEGLYQGDKLLYSAELATRTAYDALHGFVTWEKANRAALATMPEVKQYAAKVRAESRQWVNSAIALRDAYAADPSPANAAALRKALAVLREAVNQASQYMVQATTPQ